MRKPRNVKLVYDINIDKHYELVAGEKGQRIVYLKRGNDYLWIEGKRNLKAILRWAKQALEYQK